MAQHRPTVRNRTSKIFLVIGLIFGLISIPMGMFGYQTLQTENRYASESKQIDGTLITKRISESRDSDNKRSYTYYVTLKYDNEAGQSNETEDSISKESWKNLEPGNVVRMEYLPGQADSYRLLDPKRNGAIAGYLLMGMGAVFFAIGAGMLYVFIRSYTRISYLIKHGTLADGTVITVAPGSLSINNVKQWRIQYEYPDTRGKVHRAWSEHRPPEEVMHLQPGEKGRVLFNRNKPEVSTWAD